MLKLFLTVRYQYPRRVFTLRERGGVYTATGAIHSVESTESGRLYLYNYDSKGQLIGYTECGKEPDSATADDTATPNYGAHLPAWTKLHNLPQTPLTNAAQNSTIYINGWLCRPPCVCKIHN